MSETEQSAQYDQSLIVRMIDGLQAYEPIWHAMQRLTDERTPETPDEIWVLQHRPVYTQGQAGKAEHILAPGDIPVVQVDRGGQVTYHGPGQLVVYFLFDIARLGLGARALVSNIERAVIQVLSGYGIDAIAKPEAPGIYVNDDKIASIGLRIRKGKSFHGLSLNVEMDLEPFARINPCGYAGLKMIQLSSFDAYEGLEDVAGRLVKTIKEVFNFPDMLVEYSDAL